MSLRARFWSWAWAYSQRRFYQTSGMESKPQRIYKANGLSVTQHAVIRYFERVEGYNMDKVVNDITTSVVPPTKNPDAVPKIRSIIRDKTVVTILPGRASDVGNRIKFPVKLEDLRQS